MKKTLVLLLISVSLSGCASVKIPPPPPNHIPQVVAVTAFDNKSGFSGQWELGTGMADLLTAELIQTKYYTVVERRNLNHVIGEIDMQKDPHFRKEGRVENGRLINARYLIRGAITDFSQVGGGSLSVAFRKILFGGQGYNARVSITVTIIDVETGEIIDAVQCEGEAKARDIFAKTEYQGVAFGGDAFFKTPLGRATSEAIVNALATVTKTIPLTTWEPMIAEVIGDTIIVNGGTKQGLASGMTFSVRERGKPVTDPISGNVISMIAGPVTGRISITDCDTNASKARILSGTGFKRAQYLIPQK
jgi:curli biogenesis system outer membrane secretion channel CsgG